MEIPCWVLEEFSQKTLAKHLEQANYGYVS